VRQGVAMASDDGCDEFSPRSTTTAVVWNNHRAREWRIRPAEYLPADDRRGAWTPLAPSAAADEAERLLAGGGGARRGSVLLTSGAALWVAGAAPNLVAGVDRARDALDQGAAESLLEHLRTLATTFPKTQES
jgi:anthranilate phosphoribosyltransferase